MHAGAAGDSQLCRCAGQSLRIMQSACAVPSRAVPSRAVLFHAVLCLGVGVAFFTHSNMPKNVCEDSPPSCSVFFSLFNVE